MKDKRPLPIMACALATWLINSQSQASAEESTPFVVWHTGTQGCAENCRFMVFAGRFIETDMDNIFFDPVLPWDWKWRDSQFLGFALSRRILTLGKVVDVEAEGGFGRRFGELDESEAWAAIFFRWTRFPWDKVLNTTIALSTGLSYTSDISPIEIDRGGVGYGKHLLHYFSPEISFSAPSKPNLEVVLRIQHRSGSYGLVSNVTGGAQYGTVGLRWHF